MSDTNCGIGMYHDTPEEKEIERLGKKLLAAQSENQRLREEWEVEHDLLHLVMGNRDALAAQVATLKAERDAAIYRALTINSLRIRREVWLWGGMDQKQFTRQYLNDLGDYERQIAEEEGIEL